MTPLVTILQTIEAKITAAPDLGVTIADDLAGIRSATRQHASVLVFRESTSDLNETRNQDVQRVEDRIRVDLSWRVRPKDQRTSRDAAVSKSADLRSRLTDLDDTTMRKWGVVCVSERERRAGEWLTIEHVYRVRRVRTVGAG